MRIYVVEYLKRDGKPYAKRRMDKAATASRAEAEAWMRDDLNVYQQAAHARIVAFEEVDDAASDA